MIFNWNRVVEILLKNVITIQELILDRITN